MAIYSPLRPARYFIPYWYALNSSNELSFDVSTDFYIFNWSIDLTNIDKIKLVTLGRKAADVGADNYMKLYFDSTLQNTIGWNDAVEIQQSITRANTLNGFHQIKLEMSGGVDAQLLKTVLLWGTRDD